MYTMFSIQTIYCFDSTIQSTWTKQTSRVINHCWSTARVKSREAQHLLWTIKEKLSSDIQMEINMGHFLGQNHPFMYLLSIQMFVRFKSKLTSKITLNISRFIKLLL